MKSGRVAFGRMEAGSLGVPLEPAVAGGAGRADAAGGQGMGESGL